MKVPRIKSAPFADQSPVRTDCRLMNHIDQYGSTQLIARLKFTVLISNLERNKTVTHWKYGEPCWVRTSDLL